MIIFSHIGTCKLEDFLWKFATVTWFVDWIDLPIVFNYVCIYVELHKFKKGIMKLNSIYKIKLKIKFINKINYNNFRSSQLVKFY